MGHKENRAAVQEEILRRAVEKQEFQGGPQTFALVMTKGGDLHPMAGAHKADDFDTNMLMQMLVYQKNDYTACGILTPMKDHWEILLESEDGTAVKVTVNWKMEGKKVLTEDPKEEPAEPVVFKSA